jgi:DNA recombination protein RmuC
MQIVFLLLGLAIGGLAVWLGLRSRLVALRAQLDQERQTGAERAALEERFADTFRALSADALKELLRESREDHSSRQRAIEQVITPVKEQLEKVDSGVRELEKARSEAYGALSQQLRSLADTQEKLRAETSNLVTALRAPAVRGRWGEIQLRRVVEAAGMQPYCDFDEQAATIVEGRQLRPDLVVRLPGAKQVVVDAKTPLAAYLEALEAKDEETQRARLRDHARQIREHVGRLSAKSYWEQFESAPDFVVLFIPGDPFFAAALDQDPSLQEDAWKRRIVLATPSTLIGLLFVVAYGWRQEKVAESTRRVSELGKQLYERLGTFAEHLARVGKSLDGAAANYNQAIGSLESRVLVTARQFADLGIPVAKEIVELEPVERSTRSAQAPELVARVPGVASARVPAEDDHPETDTADGVPDAA